jgi:hypothetical protein
MILRIDKSCNPIVTVSVVFLFAFVYDFRSSFGLHSL